MDEQPAPTVPVETLQGVVYATRGDVKELRRQSTRDTLDALLTACTILWPWPTLLLFGTAIAGLSLATAVTPDQARAKAEGPRR